MYKDGVIAEEKETKVTYGDGNVATGKLESMVSVKE
jgi:hypothetical protein